MLVVVSPAKKLDMRAADGVAASVPAFQDQAEQLAGIARDLSVNDLQKLMGISENLARLNADRFGDFGRMTSKPAALAFAGDTYQGLEAGTLDAEELNWAQDHLRILSGLYGLLRPLDAIQPYRLEMGSRLKNARGNSLYEFWGDRISTALNQLADNTQSEVLINCASQEYFGAVDRDALNLRVITPVFMEERSGAAKVVSFYAKRARGAMARFIIQNRLFAPESIQAFDAGGYRYRNDLSDDANWVFLRDYPAA
ncbi:peroxide stress protein YaaA [Roseovarius sp. CAU 1744]|uniref:peroxide stress protein YaaA n=1 Tax=Roseovarius sp. CAU 1744 TaxID=3140368 RepID=UPI00325AE65C